MKTYWLIVVLLIASCDMPASTTKQPPATVPGAQKSILTARPVATLTPVYPTPIATLTARPVAPTQEVSAEWKVLADQLRSKAQRAMDGTFWEDMKFKEEGYNICDQLIAISDDQQKLVSQEILKRWRWGMEFMNLKELNKVIRLVDQNS